MELNNRYYIYILRCLDNSLYTGIAKDYEARYAKHIKGEGAKYTRVRKPIKIERVWAYDSGRSGGTKVEYFIKKQTKKRKEKVIEKPELLVVDVKENLKLDIVTIR